MSTTNEQRPSTPPPPPSQSPRSASTSEPARPRTKPQAERLPGPRKVRLSVARIDPWSVMKLGFLLSVAFGIMIVVATAVIWGVLDKMAVFDKMNTLLLELGNEGLLGVMEFVKFDRVMSMATIIAVVDVVLLTALSTLGAFLYNIVAALVGGIHVTMTDD